MKNLFSAGIFALLIFSASATFATPPVVTSTVPAPIIIDKAAFDNATKEYAKIAEKDDRKKYFSEKFYPYFSKRYAAVLKNCFRKNDKSSQNKPAEGFTFVMTIDKTGRVTKVNLNKATNNTDCMLKPIVIETFPAPPFQPFYQLVDMKFEK